MSYKLKLKYNDIFRRTSLQSLTHESVEAAARELFSIPLNLKVSLTWIDDEGDTVFVSSENEFNEFLKDFQSTSARSYGEHRNLYKFGIVTEVLPAAQPVASPVQHVPVVEPTGPAIHNHVSCDGCGVSPIVGTRYKCTGRDNYDLCSNCEAKCDHQFPMLKMYEPKVGIRMKVKGHGFGGKFHGHCANQTNAPFLEPLSGPAIHNGVTCNECGTGPIVGIRYKCTGRDDFDLCEKCEASKISQPFPVLKLYRPDISVQVMGWGTQGRRCPANPHGFRHAPFAPKYGGGRWRCGQQTPASPQNFVPGRNVNEQFWPRQADIAEVIANVATNIGPAVESACGIAETFFKDIDDEILKQTMELSMKDKKEKDDTKAAADKSPNTDSKESFQNKKQDPAAAKESADSSFPASAFPASTPRGYLLKPMARFVGDITIPDATIIEPSTDFVKIWLVRNDGPCDWPTFGQGVCLVTAGGDPMSQHWDTLSIPVESIKIGEETHISVTLKSPPTAGRYVSYFRLQASDGTVFGQKLWVDIRVSANPSGHIGFTSPAFTVPKPAVDKHENNSGLESKADLGDLPVAYAKASSPPLELPPVSESSEEMEFPGGDFEELALTPPVPTLSDDPHFSDFDSQWESEAEKLIREWKVELDALKGMGFHNTHENVKLLKTYTKTSFSRFPELQGKPFSDTLSTILDALLN